MIRQEFKNAAGVVYCSLYYDAEIEAAVDIWTNSFGSQDNFKNAIRQWLALVENTKSSRALTDLSDMLGSFDGSRGWMVTEIIPKAIRAGWRYHAIVQPKNVFSKLSVKDYSMNMNGVEIVQFGDFETAKTWLKSISGSRSEVENKLF